MKKLLNKFTSSQSMKNVVKISSGTMMGQVISLVAVPIYTRMYGVSVLGIWAIFTAIGTIVNSFSDLGLKNSIMVEDDEKVEVVYKVITTITMFVSIIVATLGYIYYAYIDASLEINPLAAAIFLGIITFTTPQVQTCYTWLNKDGKFNVLMKNPMISSGVMAIVAISLGVLGFTTYGYYIGSVVSSIVTLIIMKLHLPKKMFTFKKEDYKYILKTKQNYYKYQMPTNFLSQFKTQLPVFLIELFYGTNMLGYYSISSKYLKIPVTLLADSIGRVFIQKVSQMTRNGESIGEFSLKNVNRATNLAIIPMIGIIAFGDIACVIMFGSEYLVAGNIMRIVSLITYSTFLLASCGGMTVVLQQQKKAMITNILQIAGYVIGIALGYYLTNNIYVSLIIMSVIYVVLQMAFFKMLMDKAGANGKKYLIRAGLSLALILAVSLIIRLILLYFGIVTTI